MSEEKSIQPIEVLSHVDAPNSILVTESTIGRFNTIRYTARCTCGCRQVVNIDGYGRVEERARDIINQNKGRQDVETKMPTKLEGQIQVSLDATAYERLVAALRAARSVIPETPAALGTPERPLIFEEVVAARMEMLAQDIETAPELTPSEDTRQVTPEIAAFVDHFRNIVVKKIRDGKPQKPAPQPESTIGIVDYYVVNTANDGSDYPNESLAVPFSLTEDMAEEIAKILNAECGADRGGSRYYKVVPRGYVLAPGFVP